jgi:hypothetical protein
VAAALTVAALGLAACGSDPDALPTVASVDFEPRLVVVADADGIRAEPGGREGAKELDGGDADWSVPDGSVVVVRVEGSSTRRVVGQRTEAEGDDPSILLDTGEVEPGDDVVVALTEPGQVELSFDGDGATLLTISVEPR